MREKYKVDLGIESANLTPDQKHVAYLMRATGLDDLGGPTVDRLSGQRLLEIRGNLVNYHLTHGISFELNRNEVIKT
jgi:hypothetical protein